MSEAYITGNNQFTPYTGNLGPTTNYKNLVNMYVDENGNIAFNPATGMSPLTGFTGFSIQNNLKPPTDSDFGFNIDTFNLGANTLKGVGALAQGWAALKNIGLARDQLAENKRQYDQNFAMQKRAYDANVLQANQRIADQNAWKTAQGRTDLANLIVA